VVGVVRVDGFLVDSFEFADRERAEEFPAEFQTFQNRSIGLESLSDELSFEFFGEIEVQFVNFREGGFSEDDGEFANIFSTGVAGEKLIFQFRVIFAGFSLAHAGSGESGERFQNIDGRGNFFLVEGAIEDELPLGDVPGEIRNRVGDVVFGHRENRHLSDGTACTADSSGAFVNRRKIGVQISRVATATGDFFSLSGDFAEGFGVICEIGENHENMHAFFEGEVLGETECHSRNGDSLDDWVGGGVDEKGGFFDGSCFFKFSLEKHRFLEGDAHRTEHDGEITAFSVLVENFCVSGDLDGEFGVRESGSGENREFLPADERVHEIDRGNSGLNEVGWKFAGVRVDRHSGDVHGFFGENFGSAVDRFSRSVENSSEHVGGNTEFCGFSEEFGFESGGGEPLRGFEHLHHRSIAVGFENFPHFSFAGGSFDFDEFFVLDAVNALDDEDWAGDGGDVGVGFLHFFG